MAPVVKHNGRVRKYQGRVVKDVDCCCNPSCLCGEEIGVSTDVPQGDAVVTGSTCLCLSGTHNGTYEFSGDYETPTENCPGFSWWTFPFGASETTCRVNPDDEFQLAFLFISLFCNCVPDTPSYGKYTLYISAYVYCEDLYGPGLGGPINYQGGVDLECGTVFNEAGEIDIGPIEVEIGNPSSLDCSGTCTLTVTISPP